MNMIYFITGCLVGFFVINTIQWSIATKITRLLNKKNLEDSIKDEVKKHSEN